MSEVSGFSRPEEICAEKITSPIEGGKKLLRILLLEDVQNDAELIQHELRKAHILFSARCVETREAFLQSLDEFLPDIIISDFSLPGFDALGALALLKEISMEIPFILVTGSQSEEVAVQCMQAGADDYILKATLKRLPSALLNALKKNEAQRERLRALQDLQESEERFRSLIENALDLIIILNPDATFRYASPSLRAFGYKPEELVGKSFFEFISPDDTREVAEVFDSSFKHSSVAQTFEFLFRHSNGSFRVLEAIGKPIHPDSKLAGIVLNARDVTERTNLEMQLRQSQKMDSIGQLAAGIAHDFNNVLTIIRGYADMFLEKENLENELREPAEQISVAAERAANLTRQLLMFSRKQLMQSQNLDLNEIIGNVTKFLRRILGEDITLHFNYSPHLPPIHADSGMIEQIILNLAVNARDAMPRGGTLTIGTRALEINSTHARVNSEARSGHYVCLRVSDTGSGIPPEIMSRIFEPFFTTKDVGKGTGLGLATVYGIVKQHQGWSEVLSERGRGTTFRVFLPAATRLTEAVETRAISDQNCCGSENILVVEDEPELRAMVCELLKHHGYSVLQAGSGPEALPIWREQSGKIDLLLTDMVMPGNMNGRELAEKLKNEKPGLKVIYTSGYSVELIGKDFVLNRGLNFLQKPYHPLALVKVVRDCLDS